MIGRFKRLYSQNVLTRLSKARGMELHDEKVDVISSDLGYYYADFTKCIVSKSHSFDEKGILCLELPEHEQPVYNICAIAEYAIIEYEKYLRTGSEESRGKFRNHIEWLVQNASVEDDRLYWYYKFDFGGHKAPWASGISQGIGISALVRAANSFQDDEFIRLAKFAANALMAPVEDGGLRFGKGSYENWYEESHLIPHILNGHIYSILGLLDLYRFTGNEMYKRRFESGVSAIKQNIDDFDLGFFSKYGSESEFPASNSYNHLHCVLFEVLYELTSDEFFLEYVKKWRRAYDSNLWKAVFTLHIGLKLVKNKIGGAA